MATEKNGQFFVAPARSHVDILFANIQNDAISALFKCNNNVLECFDGGIVQLIIPSTHTRKRILKQPESCSTK
jgi:hypothetical protein